MLMSECGKSSASVRRGVRVKPTDVNVLLQSVKLKMTGGRALSVPVTPEGNRFANIVLVERLRKLIDNWVRLKSRRGSETSAEEILKVSRSLEYLSKISYRAYGDSHDTPELPALSSGQKMLLKQALPEAYELIKASDERDVVEDSVRLGDTIEIEADADGFGYGAFSDEDDGGMVEGVRGEG